MRYILNPDIALRSWPGAARAYYKKGIPEAFGLNDTAFQLLLLCDGKNEIEETPEVTKLLSEGIIRRCAADEELSEWQKLHVYQNRYMPRLCLEVTEKCNYRCRHCFNADDALHESRAELSPEEAVSILDQAEKCGVNCILLTGGEPFLYKQLPDLFQQIYSRNMFVDYINTNGALITREFLDFLKELGASPVFKISFDGVGFHDWMRGVPGAEQVTLDKIRLCVENGFPVWAQINVNQRNLSVMSDTLDLLDSMGVTLGRIIRTTESPRWKENAGGDSFPIADYYDAMTDLARRYMSGNHRMRVSVWHFLELCPARGEYYFYPLSDYRRSAYNENAPICKECRGMMSIGADGSVYPCMPLSGTMKNAGIQLENVKETPMKEILTDSRYLKLICTGVGERMRHNPECMECGYRKICRGGCPALGFINADRPGSFLGIDEWKCLFFQGGYMKKCEEKLRAFRNVIPLDES